jgi:hypothetical protein
MRFGEKNASWAKKESPNPVNEEVKQREYIFD